MNCSLYKIILFLKLRMINFKLLFRNIFIKNNEDNTMKIIKSIVNFRLIVWMKFLNIWKIKIYIHAYLVNRLWCEVSVRILWTDIQNYNTLIACLPNESNKNFTQQRNYYSTPIQNLYYFIIKNLSTDKIFLGLFHETLIIIKSL